MADDVTTRSPVGAPTKLSVLARSMYWMPAPGAMSITKRCSPLPCPRRSTPCIWNWCDPAVKPPGLRFVIATPFWSFSVKLLPLLLATK